MIGARLGKWIIDRELGCGGMGRVYLAHDISQESHQVAIKILAVELALETGFLNRFQREIEVLQKLHHPHIVRFYESGVQDGRYFYVMEYVPGSDFARLLEERKRLPWTEVLAMALQVSLALKHAHDRGIIHRDLKPSNLLRTSDGKVKLADFSVAYVFAGKHLTVTGAVVGTPEYVSPEQAMGKPVGRRSDLYSLGIVFYTLLTGRPPFVGENVIDVLHKHRFGQFDSPRKIIPELPHDLDAIVCQLLEKDPDRRPADAGVLYRRLERLVRKLVRQNDSTESEHSSRNTRTIVCTDEAIRRSSTGSPTLVSRLLRQEWDSRHPDGIIKQIFNRPLVLLTLLVLCISLIVWSFWPASAEKLFVQGCALMASADPHDWETAWEKYFDLLDSRYPDHPYQTKLEAYRHQLEDYHAEREAMERVRHTKPPSEAQWFYLQGLRLRQEDDEAGARTTWQHLIDVFQLIPSERPWVRLAKEALQTDKPAAASERRWGPIRAALESAGQLRAEGKSQEAEAVWRGIERLYEKDPSARELLLEVTKYRAKKEN